MHECEYFNGILCFCVSLRLIVQHLGSDFSDDGYNNMRPHPTPYAETEARSDDGDGDDDDDERKRLLLGTHKTNRCSKRGWHSSVYKYSASLFRQSRSLLIPLHLHPNLTTSPPPPDLTAVPP